MAIAAADFPCLPCPAVCNNQLMLREEFARNFLVFICALLGFLLKLRDSSLDFKKLLTIQHKT